MVQTGSGHSSKIADHLARFDTAWRARITETRVRTYPAGPRGFPQIQN